MMDYPDDSLFKTDEDYFFDLINGYYIAIEQI